MTLTRLRIELRFPLYLISLITLITITGCTYVSQGVLVDSDRHAKAAKQDSFGDSAERVVYPEQNWSGADSLWFYNVTQGSNLIPYDLFLHLETADSELLFRSDENMNHLRYLPQKESFANPDGLPVGWVKDEHAGKEFIGFTCAACHTSQINYQGVAIRIDGGATLADMEQMLKSLAMALQASLEQPEKFERLAQKVLETKYPDEKEAFRIQLADAAQKIASYNQINDPRHGDQLVAYGYGRLDAFGRIYNRVLAHLTPKDSNFNPACAPVSYPYLWDTPQHDFVQWNGVGDNELAGPLGRNTGEAIGVFAQVDLNKKRGDIGYRSSVAVRNLTRMERHLESLWSPSWEELAQQNVLPPINQVLAEQGQQVFVEYQCHTCHEAIDRTDPKRRIISQFASLQTIGTDPYMAMNALKYSGKMGYFEGQRINPFKLEPRFQQSGAVLPALSSAVEGVLVEPDHDKWLIRRWAEKLYDLVASISDNPIKKTERHLDFEVVNKNNPSTLAAYKARPLNGIWATAPYLHNGSVPSLYELFMPSCSDAEIASGKTCRPNRFTVGTRELDAITVGVVQRDPAQYPGLFVFDTSLPSNSNKGHEYAAGVTPVFVLDTKGHPVKDTQGKPKMQTLQPISNQQRLALVEYLKTL
ncbi:MAG: di-heme-cytochrome C peroxidase [Cellvibrio sp.]|uniref:di-heme-cytochrome C peroxidase n=1 Tax=Cellvibrio sp. TaxID=1965322 RepID=UPI0027278CE8|nr:di-heme-cytochrome C peroxidase [Cellvibrio sp.]